MGQSGATDEHTLQRYRTIVADPPWPYRGPAVVGFGARYEHGERVSTGKPAAKPIFSPARYGSISLPDLCGLKLPETESDAHLYLWTTNHFLVEAHELAAAWGFKQKTVLTWVKTTTGEDKRAKVPRRDRGTLSALVAISGAGYYFRGATEHCLFCVRGSLRLKTPASLPTAFLWPRMKNHSFKPDAFYDLVEEASPGPYAELFSRRARFGWDYPIGDESLGGVAA